MIYRRATDISFCSVVITDKEANIVYVNEYFSELTGYFAEEVLGKNPRILQSGKQSPDVYLDMWNTVTNGKPWFGEFANKRKDGSLFWEKVRIEQFVDEEGEIFYIGIKEDITALKRLEDKLKILDSLHARTK